jgi:hypothetical protein
MSTPRRSFLSRLAALLAVGSAPATLAAAVRPESHQSRSPPRPSGPMSAGSR